MPKRSSPRKLSRRNRRRIQCSRCGVSYSYSGSRSHICFDQPTANMEVEEENAHSDFCGALDNQESDPNETFQSDESDTEPILSADLRRRLKDRLRKRFDEEDLAHFDDESCESDVNEDLSDDADSNHMHDHDVCNERDLSDSLNEDWDGSHDSNDAEEDFHQQQDDDQDDQENNSSMPLSDKCGVVVFWLLLFLFSWQSGFSVTDTAMEMLLKFLSRFFWLVGSFDENSNFAKIAKLMPNTLYKLKRHLGLLSNDDFVKYVVCPKCKTLYDYKDCIEKRCGRQVSARCKFVPWSRHPHRSKRGKLQLLYLGKLKIYKQEHVIWKLFTFYTFFKDQNVKNQNYTSCKAVSSMVCGYQCRKPGGGGVLRYISDGKVRMRPNC